MMAGMIRMKGAASPVWAVPYDGNFAAMALLAANDLKPNSEDLHRVERWLLWYAEQQKPDGTIDDQEGTVSSYKANGRRDSTDSYAATFLMAVARYQRAIGDRTSLVIDHAAIKALSAIEAVSQKDGLTIAKPDYPMKYLMDNIEVYGGLQEGAAFLAARGYPAEAAQARQMAQRAATGLAGYWSEKDRCFAFALDLQGKFSGGLKKSYPHGLAQLFALAHIAPQRVELWHDVQRTFKPGDVGMPVERWLIAATRCGEAAEREHFRRATREAMLRFTANNVYVNRPAVAILAIIDGEARFRDLR